jgi:hypothetical protein
MHHWLSARLDHSTDVTIGVLEHDLIGCIELRIS